MKKARLSSPTSRSDAHSRQSEGHTVQGIRLREILSILGKQTCDGNELFEAGRLSTYFKSVVALATFWRKHFGKQHHGVLSPIYFLSAGAESNFNSRVLLRRFQQAPENSMKKIFWESILDSERMMRLGALTMYVQAVQQQTRSLIHFSFCSSSRASMMENIYNGIVYPQEMLLLSEEEEEEILRTAEEETPSRFLGIGSVLCEIISRYKSVKVEITHFYEPNDASEPENLKLKVPTPLQLQVINYIRDWHLADKYRILFNFKQRGAESEEGNMVLKKLVARLRKLGFRKVRCNDEFEVTYYLGTLASGENV
jgi:hypothetical protein